jgi:hypothetical protein
MSSSNHKPASSPLPKPSFDDEYEPFDDAGDTQRTDFTPLVKNGCCAYYSPLNGDFVLLEENCMALSAELLQFARYVFDAGARLDERYPVRERCPRHDDNTTDDERAQCRILYAASVDSDSEDEEAVVEVSADNNVAQSDDDGDEEDRVTKKTPSRTERRNMRQRLASGTA